MLVETKKRITKYTFLVIDKNDLIFLNGKLVVIESEFENAI